ncbi:neurotrypsin-like [Halichondria panicea]|uniref:neurotrypsin-like n=1 Tax=Halichondria panicea TaxID=6063 RepID=UPI00312BC1B1
MASICLVLLTIVIVIHTLADGQVCKNGTVRLVRYGSFNEEYVQYCHDGEWHSLCAGGGTWSRVEANVVCRQLGLSGQRAKKGGDTTPTANPPYFMFGDTSCAGGESNIGECRIHTNSTCSDRAGWVKCQPANCTDGTVRLVGGFTNREGRVDFCTQGHWASICYNEVLADTVCNMLGFPMQGAMAKSTTSSIDPKVDYSDR